MKCISVTPCYAPAAMFDASASMLTWTPGVVSERWVLLNHYPLPSVDENNAAIREAARRHGYLVHDSGGDLGLHGSLNAFLAAHPQPAGTVMLYVDPDSGCDTPGWDKAIADVIAVDPRLPVVALGIPETPAPNAKVAGHRVFIHPSMMMFNVTGFSLDFIARCGGFDQQVKYWGGIEACIYDGLKREGAHIAYLTEHRNIDYAVLRDAHDPRYATWKWEHYYGRFPGSFADYLERP